MKTSFLLSKSKIVVDALLIMTISMGTFFAKAQSSNNFSFSVKKEGKGKPIIFIPGLYCSGDVWNNAVNHFKTHYECYRLTLPGFAGQPPIQSDSILVKIAYQLADFIKQNKLNKPVIVGHSLGGWLALKFATLYPQLAGDLVIVSSAPFLPALSMGQNISIDSAKKIGLIIKKGMIAQKPEQLKQTQKYVLATMMRDSDKIAQVAEMALESDPATQGEVMEELFSNDLRNEVVKIKSRILALGDWVSYKQYGVTRETVYNNLKEQYRQSDKITIAITDSSKHFIMFDEPQWFNEQVDDFLKRGSY